MKKEPEWLSTNVAVEYLQDRMVTVKSKYAGQVKAQIAVEATEKGLMVLSAQYDSSPFPDLPKPSKFYLTQLELDDFLKNPAKCVLDEPLKQITIQ